MNQRMYLISWVTTLVLCVSPVYSFSSSTDRRSVLRQILISSTATTSLIPAATAWAAPDCYSDCFKNCKLIAPKDLDYCKSTCQEYCEQPDRNDGLSGSVSSSGGETGILGGTFGQGTVPKGEDKPPSINIPGLDFSSATGRKLIGY